MGGQVLWGGANNFAEIIWLESRVKDLFGESCQRWNGWKYKIVNFWVISFLALAGRSSENENDPWSTAFITRVKTFTYFVHNTNTLSQNYIVSLGQRRSRALIDDHIKAEKTKYMQYFQEQKSSDSMMLLYVILVVWWPSNMPIYSIWSADPGRFLPISAIIRLQLRIQVKWKSFCNPNGSKHKCRHHQGGRISEIFMEINQPLKFFLSICAKMVIFDWKFAFPE